MLVKGEKLFGGNKNSITQNLNIGDKFKSYKINQNAFFSKYIQNLTK